MWPQHTDQAFLVTEELLHPKMSISSYLERVVQVLRNRLPAIGFSLLPSPLQNRLRAHSEPGRPQGKTAYLDGFRGYAALGVLILHATMAVFPNSNYGYNGDEGRDYVWQLPFFRLLYTGQPTLFFLISGYVLSLGTLKKARSQAYGPMQIDLSSKIFRRGLRLYLPSIVATLLPCLLMYFGLFPNVVSFDERMPHATIDFPEPQSTLHGELWKWIKTITPLFWPFDFRNMSQNSLWAFQLWTIPVEFRCSMVLFLVNSALARCTPRVRLCLNGIVAVLLLALEKWDIFLFLAGAFLAELDLIKDEKAAREPLLLDIPEKQLSERKSMRKWFIFRVWVLLVSLWLLSVPAADIWNTQAFAVLETFAPRMYTSFFRFWDAVGTFMLIWSFTVFPAIQDFFSHRVFLYLGKISFSLYLTHTIALKGIFFPLLPWVWSLTGWQTDFSYAAGFLICGVVTIFFALWIADLFHRFVEQPSAELTNWLDRKCSVATQ